MPINSSEVKRLYVEEKRSSIDIARVMGCNKSSVLKCLKRLGVDRRDLSESHMGHFPTPEQIAKQRATCKARFQGAGHSQWKGGRILDSTGYIRIWVKDHPFTQSKGYVFEHRLVMEKKIGRYLRPEEVVHHINGIRIDNDPENLMLFKNNAEHLAYPHKPRED